jgi:predicted phage tail protein
MEEEPRVRRPRAAGVVGIVLGALFLALGAAAFFVGGGPIVGAIALAGGALTVAASVYTLVRP